MFIIAENNSTKVKSDYTRKDKDRIIRAEIITVTYKNDDNNIRVSQTIDGVETKYLLDSNRDYAQVLEEYNNSGVQVSYVYGWDLISQNRGGQKSFYLYDGLGSVRALTNPTGTVTDRYNYNAYGNLINSSGSSTNNYLFTGEQYDRSLGDYYLRDRYYGTDIGRFTRSDVWEGRLTDPLSLNKYLYTHGNPINAIDPSGFFTLQDATTALVIFGLFSNGVQLGFNLNGYFNSESDEERIKYTISAGFNLLGLLLATPTTTFIPPTSGGAAALVPAVVSLDRAIGSAFIPISQTILSISSSGNNGGNNNIDVNKRHMDVPKHCLDDLASTWVQQEQIIADAAYRVTSNNNVPGLPTRNGYRNTLSFSTYVSNSQGNLIPVEIRAIRAPNGKITVNSAFVPKQFCSHP